MEVCICVLPAFLHGVRKAGEWSLGTRLPDPHTPGVGSGHRILLPFYSNYLWGGGAVL